MKKYILLILFLILLVPGWCWGAAFTATQAGNLNDGATFGNTSPGVEGTDFPGSGDTLDDGGYAITVTTSTTVGNAGASDIVISGAITINNSVVFTAAGGCVLTGTINIGAGSTWSVDGNYNLLYGGMAYLNIAGTAGSRSEWSATAGNSTRIIQQTSVNDAIEIDADYTDFIRMGTASDSAMTLCGNGDTYDVSFNGCLFNYCGSLTYGFTAAPAAGATFKIDNCDFRNTAAGSSGFVILFSVTANNENAKWIKNSTFTSSDNAKIYMKTGASAYPLVYSGNVSRDTTFVIGGKINISDSLYYRTVSSSASAFTIANYGPKNISNSVFISNRENDHVLVSADGNTGDVIVSGNVFECPAATGDTTNFLMVGELANPSTWSVTQNIFLGHNPLLLRKAGGDWSGTCLFERNTHIAQVNQDVLILYETGIPTGTVTSRSNIHYAVDESSPFRTYDAIVSSLVGTDPELNLSIDYTAIYDLALDSDRFVNFTISEKNIGDAGFGGSDVRADPGFSNIAATFASWGGDTVANVLEEVISINGRKSDGTSNTYNTSMTVANFISYIQSAMAPSSLLLDGTAYNGDDFGAIDFTGVSTGHPAAALMGM